MTRISFTKAQGAGNDFLILVGQPDSLLASAEAKHRLCDRHYGIGADGIIFISSPSRLPGVDADLRIFNSDGAEAEISGNGTRCAAAYLVHRRLAGHSLALGTPAGIKRLTLLSRHENRFVFDMDMGAPIFAAAPIPFRPPAPVSEPILNFPLPLSSGSRSVTITSMGNPHCSVAVDSFDWDWRSCGREIESHPFFPRRTNVEFYKPLSSHSIAVRFWERGVGETLSSGTGSCAAAVAAILNRLAQSPVTVHTSAGQLVVRWENERVLLTGPAEILCEGEFFAPDEFATLPAREEIS